MLALHVSTEPLAVSGRRALNVYLLSLGLCTLDANNPRCDLSMYFAVWYCCAALSAGLSSQNVLWEVCLISYVLDRYWSSSRHLLCVYVFCRVLRLCCLCLDLSYYVHWHAVLPRTCRTMCTGILCYPLHSSAPLTSRHLLCMHVYRVLRLCCPVPGRVVLCVPVYYATQNVSYYVYRCAVLPIA